MICSRCGVQIGNSSIFCPNCGEQASAGNSQYAAYPENPMNAQGASPPPYYGQYPSSEPRPYDMPGPPQYVNSPLHWLPLILCGVAFFIFGALGGDPDFEEVNTFDYIAAFISIGAFSIAFFVVPKCRSTLRIWSFVVRTCIHKQKC